MTDSDELTLNIDDSSDKPSKEKGSGGNKKRIMIVAAVVAFIIASVAAGLILFLSKEAPESDEQENPEVTAPKAEQVKVHFETLYQLERMEVTLGDMGGGRMFKVLIRLEMDSVETGEEITHRKPQIEEAIKIILSSKTLNELLSADGKILLRHEIVKRLNHILETGRIKSVYFSEYLII